MWALLALLVAAATPAAGEAVDDRLGGFEPGEVPRVDHLFFDTDLHEALADISAQTGVPILVGATVEGTITLELHDTPLPKALDMVLARGGFTWRDMNGYILVGPAGPESPLFVELSETREIKLSHVRAPDLIEMISPVMRIYVNAGEQENRVTVTAPPATLRRIVADIERLDVPERHVLLEARVVVLERESQLDLGIDWDFPQTAAGHFVEGVYPGGGSPTGVWAVRTGLTPGREFTNALLLSLNLLQQNREATIVANPELVVRGGEQAQLSVLTEERFRVTAGTLAERVELETVSSGTVLTIMPTIGADGQINLRMDVEVSNVVGRGEGDLPVVTRRNAQSTVQVRDGGTAAIAGLMDSRTDILDRSVPGMSQVPLLGSLFNRDSAAQQSKQLAVFVTATLADAPEPRTRRLPTEIPLEEDEVFRNALRDAMERLRRN